MCVIVCLFVVPVVQRRITEGTTRVNAKVCFSTTEWEAVFLYYMRGTSSGIRILVLIRTTRLYFATEQITPCYL